MHNSANGIRTVNDRAGSEYNFHTIHNAIVHRDNILKVSPTINRIIQTNAIDHHQHFICLKATYNGTPSTQLAFLDKDIA